LIIYDLPKSYPVWSCHIASINDIITSLLLLKKDSSVAICSDPFCLQGS